MSAFLSFLGVSVWDRVYVSESGTVSWSGSWSGSWYGSGSWHESDLNRLVLSGSVTPVDLPGMYVLLCYEMQSPMQATFTMCLRSIGYASFLVQIRSR